MIRRKWSPNAAKIVEVWIRIQETNTQGAATRLNAGYEWLKKNLHCSCMVINCLRTKESSLLRNSLIPSSCMLYSTQENMGMSSPTHLKRKF